MPLMLRLGDGEVWEVEPGAGTDENTVKARPARPRKGHPEADHDRRAIAEGCPLVQTAYGGDLYHEVRRVR